MKRLAIHALAAALLLTGLSALSGCNGARDTALNAVSDSANKGFMIKTLTLGTHQRKYGLFVPTTYDASRHYPVIIFLHGIGEGGSDARANLRVGLAPFVADRMSEFPFICIFPQSGGSWDENSEDAAAVIATLDAVSKMYSVDQDRVSLTGLSTGGYGTYAIGAKYKDRFAALVPMGSNASASKYAGDLVNIPLHAYCNGGDMFGAFGANDRGMVEKIKTMGGKYAEFTQTDGPGHDCWEGVYGSGELFNWLLQQRRHGTASTPMPAKATSGIVAPAAPGSRAQAAAAPRANASVSVATPSTPY